MAMSADDEETRLLPAHMPDRDFVLWRRTSRKRRVQVKSMFRERTPNVWKLLLAAVACAGLLLASGPGSAAEEKPKWYDTIKIKVDLRLRYQYEDTTGSEERNRGRIRYRITVDGQVVDNMAVVLRLASGSSDPRSTNQTFDDVFSSKPINLDQAFVKYTPAKWVELDGGKISNPFWSPSDLLWDSDINPEGVAAKLSFDVDSVDIFVNTGFFVLDEKSSEDDVLMYAVQPGVKVGFAENGHVKLAAAFYGFSNLDGNTLNFSAGSNTGFDTGLVFDYNSFAISAEVGMDKVSEPVPYIAVFGEFIDNPDPDDDNTGYLGGLKFGAKSIKEGGQWQATYMYRRLERDAWLDVFPDSDFLGGATNAQGHEAIVEVGLMKNVTLGFDYYHAEEIEGDTDQDLFQADLVFKF
jgi:hypothetical protein